MKRYDEFPGYENIPSVEIVPGVFKVLEPFIIDDVKWFADSEFRDVICDRVEDSDCDIIIYCFEAGVNRINDLRNLVDTIREEHPTAYLYSASFAFSYTLGGVYV